MMKEGLEETLWELLSMDFEGVQPLNNPSLPVDVLLPYALMTLFSSRSLCESLRSGSPRREKGATVCTQIAATWRSSAVGRLSTGPSSVATTTTVWSPSPTSSRLPLISPCASQSMPLMWWCPSFTYSIFDLSHFIQLNPVEVESQTGYSLFSSTSSSSFSFLLSLVFSKMTT